LLRKAVKRTLLEPAGEEYRRFADRLLEIYRAACRVRRDRNPTKSTRRNSCLQLTLTMQPPTQVALSN
jgi:DNA-binding transcriptional LysR family regulator